MDNTHAYTNIIDTKEQDIEDARVEQEIFLRKKMTAWSLNKN